MTLHISTAFDSGAIDVVSLAESANIQLNIRKDNASEFAQCVVLEKPADTTAGAAQGNAEARRVEITIRK